MTRTLLFLPLVVLGLGLSPPSAMGRPAKAPSGKKLHRFEPFRTGQRLVYKVRQGKENRTTTTLVKRISQRPGEVAKVELEVRAEGFPTSLQTIHYSRDGRTPGVEGPGGFKPRSTQGLVLPAKLKVGARWTAHSINPLDAAGVSTNAVKQEVRREVVSSHKRWLRGWLRTVFVVESTITASVLDAAGRPDSAAPAVTTERSEYVAGVGEIRKTYNAGSDREVDMHLDFKKSTF